jgi:maltose O-acetyltransferase
VARSEKEKMLAGELYHPGCPELQAEPEACAAWLARYNAVLGEPAPVWHRLLRERLQAVGEGAMLRPPFHCDYGFNIRLGAGVFLNYNCVILDTAQVTIGDDTRIGPAVQIYTADHPRDPAVRRSGLEKGEAVSIGNKVWIGAGSVVTRDVPAGATVAGNPARIVGVQARG